MSVFFSAFPFRTRSFCTKNWREDRKEEKGYSVCWSFSSSFVVSCLRNHIASTEIYPWRERCTAKLPALDVRWYFLNVFLDKIVFSFRFCTRQMLSLHVHVYCKYNNISVRLPAECQPVFNGPAVGQRGRQKICSSLLWGRRGRGTDRLCRQQNHNLNACSTHCNIKIYSQFLTTYLSILVNRQWNCDFTARTEK